MVTSLFIPLDAETKPYSVQYCSSTVGFAVSGRVFKMGKGCEWTYIELILAHPLSSSTKQGTVVEQVKTLPTKTFDMNLLAGLLVAVAVARGHFLPPPPPPPHDQ